MPDSIVSLNEESLRADLRELVRRTVEEVLNGLLDEEADDLVGAERHERTADREAYRAGHHERKLTTTSGEVTIRMPKLKGMRFTAAIIERHRRRETSVEEAMMEMHLAGVSTRRIEDASEILRGRRRPRRPPLTSTRGRSRPWRRGGTGPSSGRAPTSTWTESTSSAAGEAPARTWPRWWRQASTTTATARP